MALITVDAGEGPVPATASSVIAVRAQPPLQLFSVSALSGAAGVLVETETVVVRFLDTHDIEVAKLGASSRICRFAQLQTWTRLERGETVYDGVPAWVRCTVTERVPLGESTVYVVRDMAP